MLKTTNETNAAKVAQDVHSARTARTARTANTGKLTEITQGSWEAEGKVIVVRPENKSGGSSRTLLLYEASIINCGEPKNLGLNSQKDKKAELESELEVNARAIAAVPDMLSLLKDLLIITTTSGNVPRDYDLKIVELLLNIYDADSVIIDKDRIIVTREARGDGNHNDYNERDNHSDSNCRDDHESHYEKQAKSAKQPEQPEQPEKSDNFVFHGECRNCKYREECECADYDYEDDEDNDNDEDEDEDIDTDSVEDDDNLGKCRVKHYIFQL